MDFLAAAARMAERRGGAGVLGGRARKPAWPAVFRCLVRRACQVASGAGPRHDRRTLRRHCAIGADRAHGLFRRAQPGEGGADFGEEVTPPAAWHRTWRPPHSPRFFLLAGIPGGRPVATRPECAQRRPCPWTCATPLPPDIPAGRFFPRPSPKPPSATFSSARRARRPAATC